MTRTIEIIRGIASPPEGFVPLLVTSVAAEPVATDPRQSSPPVLRHAEIAAVYHGLRVAGDFYEFLRVGPSRVLFGLFDLAGRRQDTREILIATQHTFRTLAPELFAGADFNEAEALSKLCHEVNLTILRVADGVRSCPAFIGCYNEDVGTVCYANAGHTPGLLRDDSGIAELNASGLPLGIFSHATYSATTCALAPGAVLLIASRGIVEAEHDNQEFGLEGTRKGLQAASALTAQDLCLSILQAAQQFMEAPPAHNDVTALALLRHRDASLPRSRKPGQKATPKASTAKRSEKRTRIPVGS